MLLQIDDSFLPHGFYINVDVEAHSEDEAFEKGKRLVVSLLQAKKNINLESINHIAVDDIRELAEEEKSNGQQGFVWYPMQLNA